MTHLCVSFSDLEECELDLIILLFFVKTYLIDFIALDGGFEGFINSSKGLEAPKTTIHLKSLNHFDQN